MLTLLKNTQLYAPSKMGKKDILIANDKIIAIEDNLSEFENKYVKIIDVDNKISNSRLNRSTHTCHGCWW